VCLDHLEEHQLMMTRRSVQFRPQCDGLETKALLSTLALSPVTRVAAVVAPAQNDNGSGDTVERDRFRLRGSDTDYELKVRSGQYRFSHDYEMDINRVRGDNAGQVGTGLTAIDAMDVFFSRLSNRLGGVQASQDTGGDYTVERERFTQRGGRTYYELKIRSGGYEFKQSYELKVHRVNRGPNTGISALEAFDDFQARLFDHATNAVIGGGGGSGGGGTTVRVARRG
jgi:hypothetical protein